MSAVVVLSLMLFFVTFAFLILLYFYGVDKKWWNPILGDDTPPVKPVTPVIPVRNCSELEDYKDGDYKCKFPGVVCNDTTSAIPENRIKWMCYAKPRFDKKCDGPCWDAYKESN